MRRVIILSVVIGVVLIFLAFIYWNHTNRYTLINSRFGVYKVDRKTGESWYLRGNTMEKVETPKPTNTKDQLKKEGNTYNKMDSYELGYGLDELIRLGMVSEDEVKLHKEDNKVLSEYRKFLNFLKVQNIEAKREVLRTMISLSILNESDFTVHDITLRVYYYDEGILIDTQELIFDDYIGKGLVKRVSFGVPESLEDNSIGLTPEYSWDKIRVKVLAARRVGALDLVE